MLCVKSLYAKERSICKWFAEWIAGSTTLDIDALLFAALSVSLNVSTFVACHVPSCPSYMVAASKNCELPGLIVRTLTYIP